MSSKKKASITDFFKPKNPKNPKKKMEEEEETKEEET